MATGQAYPPGAHTGFRDRIQGVVGVMIASSTLLNVGHHSLVCLQHYRLREAQEMCDKIAELEQANQKAVEDLDSEVSQHILAQRRILFSHGSSPLPSTEG